LTTWPTKSEWASTSSKFLLTLNGQSFSNNVISNATLERKLQILYRISFFESVF
jgi:hypothetical protein